MDLETLIIILRWITLVFSAVVAVLSVRGFIAFGRGNQWPSTFMRSLAFLYALSAGMLQSGYLLEGMQMPPPANRLALSLAVNVLAAVFALWGLLAMRKHPIGKMRRVYEHVDEAMAIALLADVNPAAAKRLTDEARRLTAECLVNGRCE